MCKAQTQAQAPKENTAIFGDKSRAALFVNQAIFHNGSVGEIFVLFVKANRLTHLEALGERIKNKKPVQLAILTDFQDPGSCSTCYLAT